jgi:hypothetical protein
MCLPILSIKNTFFYFSSVKTGFLCEAIPRSAIYGERNLCEKIEDRLHTTVRIPVALSLSGILWYFLPSPGDFVGVGPDLN